MNNEKMKLMKNSIEEEIFNGHLKTRIDVLYHILGYSNNEVDLETALSIARFYAENEMVKF